MQWLKKKKKTNLLYHNSVGQKSVSLSLNSFLFSRYYKTNFKVSGDLCSFLEAQGMNLLPAHSVGQPNSAIRDFRNEFSFLYWLSVVGCSQIPEEVFMLQSVAPFILQTSNGGLRPNSVNLTNFLFSCIRVTHSERFLCFKGSSEQIHSTWIIQNNCSILRFEALVQSVKSFHRCILVCN